MIVENPKARRAERFAAIVDLGLAAWARRWPLYLTIAVVSTAIEYAAAVFARYDGLAVPAVASCVDGFATAFVSLDVAARFSDETRSLPELARSALKRWPVVAVVLIAILFLNATASSWLFGSPEDTLYGMLILPGLAVLGTLGITSVIASVDTSVPQLLLPGYALIRSATCAAVWPNVGRVTIAGAIIAVQSMLQQLLQQWLTSRGFAAGPAFFWANVPIDALCVAPFQAFFAYLYLDFTVREQRR